MEKIKQFSLKYMEPMALTVIIFYLFDFILRDVFGQLFININVVYGLISVFTFFFLIYCLGNKEKRLPKIEGILIVSLFIITLISLARGYVGFYAYRINAANHFIWLFLIYLYIRIQKNNEHRQSNINKIVFGLLVFCSVITFISFALYVVETGFGIDLNLQSWSGKLGNGSRFTGVLSNPNPLGHLAFMGGAASLYLFTEFSTKKVKYVFLIPIFVDIAIIYLTGCRSALVAIGIVLLLVFYQWQRKVKFKSPWIKIAIALVIVIGVIVVGYRVLGLNRFDSTDLLKSETITEILNKITSARYEIWLETIELAKDNWLFGLGYGNLFETAQQTFGTSSIIVRSNVGVPHNIFLELYFSAGLVGVTIFGGYCVYLGAKCIDYVKHNLSYNSAIAVGALLGLFLISQLDVGVLYSGSISPMFWLFAAIVISEANSLNSKN